ncbi:MAG: SDR family NAD(P)-dependent oxidoreductase [Chlamydiota bacterium]
MGLDVIITGANRGIGLGFTQHCLARGDRVIATYRTEESLDHLTEVRPGKFTCLRKLQSKHPERLILQPLDVTSEEDVARCAATVEKLDLLILNAGIKGYSVPGTKTKDHSPHDLRAALEVNTLATNHIWSCFYRLISKTPNAGVIYMGSLVGLPKDNTSGNYHPYRVSKNASHHMMWNLFLQLTQDWRSQAVQNLKSDPSLALLKESIKAVLSYSPDTDLLLEQIEGALTTTPLIPKFSQTPPDESLTCYLNKWLELALPDEPLKKPLQDKILRNLIQTPFQQETGIKVWIQQALEKTNLIDAKRIEVALLSPSSIEQIETYFHERLIEDPSKRESPLSFDIETWAQQALTQVPSLDVELKNQIIRVITETPFIQQWREKMLETLSEAPFAAAICAGWVRTDMGGPHARLSIQESTRYMMEVVKILRRTKEANGLLMYDGTIAEKYPTSPELEEIIYAINRREAALASAGSSASSSSSSSFVPIEAENA